MIKYNNILEKILSFKNDNVHKVITITGIQLKIKSNKLIKRALERDKAKKEKKQDAKFQKIKEKLSNKKVILYIDHSLGGGTEFYFVNQLRETKENQYIIRIQYFLKKKGYTVSLHDLEENIEITNLDLNIIYKQCSNFNIDKIVLNNIVGYPQVKEILDFITNFKRKEPKTTVILCGHDYYSICPSWTLLDSNNVYCNAENDENKCKECVKTFKLPCKDIKNGFSINKWRYMWGNFIQNTADEIRVFSEFSKKVFVKAYPFIENKITVTPHKLRPFPKYNIAILGNLNLAKGSKIIADFVNYLLFDNINDFQLFLIGENSKKINSPYLTEIGSYERNNLPNILHTYNIDCIFIPSICPETFSYTTQEAIALNYPVICFDIGGQADQVKNYTKGKILSSFKPKIIEKELREFMEEYKGM